MKLSNQLPTGFPVGKFPEKAIAPECPPSDVQSFCQGYTGRGDFKRRVRVAILAGRGALKATEEIEQVAELLGVPIVKALLGKAVVPDDSPCTTGLVGLLGTKPSQEVIRVDFQNTIYIVVNITEIVVNSHLIVLDRHLLLGIFIEKLCARL
jgi:TPP-dependent trihydroxycyclohexane-1,2-dione (THcHDO) dehydratase